MVPSSLDLRASHFPSIKVDHRCPTDCGSFISSLALPGRLFWEEGDRMRQHILRSGGGKRGSAAKSERDQTWERDPSSSSDEAKEGS